MNGKSRFGKLLEPGQIGRVKTRNRIVKTAAALTYRDEGTYHVSDRIKDSYEAIVKGGVGLIIVESTSFDFPLGHHLFSPRIDDDECIPGFSELTQIIHKHGCPTFLQLVHNGIWHEKRWFGLQPVSSSSLTKSELPFPMWDEPRGLTIPEIAELVDKCARAAERAQKAGFDGVEINAASSHLFNSFLSIVTNKRQDEYGPANLESRSRFLVEVIREIKQRLGHDFPVGVLINGAEYGVDKGTSIEEAQGFARIVEQAGIDFIQVRAWGYGEYIDLDRIRAILYPEPPKPLARGLDGSRNGAGLLLPLAAGIKEVVSIPVITVGRIDHHLGEKILQQDKADFIGMTKRLLADPELPNKVASNRLEDIRPCISCDLCIEDAWVPQPTFCMVNAALGREREYEIKPAAKKKRVLIVGGGPAGMEAARVAALRGHEVTLYEKEPKLGGLLPLAALVKGPEFEELAALVRYFKTQIVKLGVKVRLGKEANPSVIEGIRPEVVIIATGGIPAVPEIPGINRPNVVNRSDLYRRLKIYLRLLGTKLLEWLTRFWMPLGKRVIIIGGAIQGCELAEFLVKRGRKVTIVDTAEAMGDGLRELAKMSILGWLANKGVTMMTEVKYEEITDKGLTILTKEGKKQTIEADNIVPALPLMPNTELLKALEGKVPEIYLIGDCREPHLALEAIADGSRIARAI